MHSILAHIHNHVLAITLNRPDKKNALTLAMYQQLAELFKAAAIDDSIRVVTIYGNEHCFSAGNDLNDFVGAGLLDDSHPVIQFLQIIAVFEKPIIAAVAGPAVGIGTTLLLHCDLVYGASNALFQLPFVALGLCPEGGSSLLLPRLMGYHKAAEMLLFGGVLTAQQALENGIINAIITEQPLASYLQGRAEQLAKQPVEAVIQTKRLLKGDQDQIMAVLDQEILAFGRLLHSPSCQQIIQSLIAGKGSVGKGVADKN